MSCPVPRKIRIPRLVNALGILSCVLLPGLGWAEYSEQPQFYVGVAVGASTVEPDKAETGTITVDDQDTGYKIFAGQELTDHLAVEAFALDLGRARLENGEKVGYRGYGAGILLNAPSNSTLLSGYLKGGLAYQQISSSIPVDIATDIEAYAGLGVELQSESGLSVRGEYEYYTTDTQLLSLSILKRFGGDEKSGRTTRHLPQNSQLEASVPVTSSTPVSPLRKAEAQVATNADADGDGVGDAYDQCPSTPLGAIVNLRGCANFIGIVRGVRFASGSAALDDRSRARLDKVATNMLHYANRQFVVIGHADSMESAAARQLSLTRAYRAARYLVSKGVPARNLRFAGAGDRHPLVSNRTAKGRAYNRRIEIRFANKKQ